MSLPAWSPSKLPSLHRSLSHLVCVCLLAAVLECLRADYPLEVNVQGVAGGHHVVVVDQLDEGLHTAAASLHLGGGALGHLGQAGGQITGQQHVLVSCSINGASLWCDMQRT